MAAIELSPATTEIKQTSAAPKPIFHAPSQFRYSRVSDFEPKLVSIGPYLYAYDDEQENLKAMEHFKFRCQADLLTKRPAGSSNTAKVPVEQFMQFEMNARQFYKEEFNLPREKFVDMLIRDSCFIIRIILSLSDEKELRMPLPDVNIKEVRSDLLLLENQIPLFFIMEIFNWLFGAAHGPKFETALERFIIWDMPFPLRTNLGGMPIIPKYMSSKVPHLLALCWLHLGGRGPDNYQFEQVQLSWKEIYTSINQPKAMENATLLHQMAGIKFKNTRQGIDLFVSFHNGIMRMPCLKINSIQTTLLVNLIAFEDCISLLNRIVSPYIKLMDALIDSEKNMELLQQCGVISNSLSSHNIAATFFNDIGNFCSINNDQYDGLYENVQKYYDSVWNCSMAILRQKYFSSPWSYISVGAGTILLILAAVQTHYTIHPPNH